MRLAAAIVAGVFMAVGLYQTQVYVYRWLVARGVRKLQRQRSGSLSGSFHKGGPVSAINVRLTADTSAFQTAMSRAQQTFITQQGKAGYTAGQIMSGIFADARAEPAEPLEETWSNEKVEAWRIISVTVDKGDPDGLWLGFPHPDGPTADVVTPVRHPVGEELHAVCDYRPLIGLQSIRPAPCEDVPGEHCKSGVGWGCGFYAYKTHGQAVTASSLGWESMGLNAVARVLLSGKVIEHEAGYRAEILEVVEVEPPTPVADRFEQEFGRTASMLAQVHVWPNYPTNPFINLGGGT